MFLYTYAYCTWRKSVGTHVHNRKRSYIHTPNLSASFAGKGVCGMVHVTMVNVVYEIFVPTINAIFKSTVVGAGRTVICRSRNYNVGRQWVRSFFSVLTTIEITTCPTFVCMNMHARIFQKVCVCVCVL